MLTTRGIVTVSYVVTCRWSHRVSQRIHFGKALVSFPWEPSQLKSSARIYPDLTSLQTKGDWLKTCSLANKNAHSAFLCGYINQEMKSSLILSWSLTHSYFPLPLNFLLAGTCKPVKCFERVPRSAFCQGMFVTPGTCLKRVLTLKLTIQ